MTTPSAEHDDVRAEINVTPLVDVVLVLLVILLMVAPMLDEQVAVELPVAANAAEREATSTPTLAIGADGGVSFEGAPLPSDALAERLRALFATRAEKAVMLAADRNLAYARVVEVMDACRAAGIERIGIVTTGPATGAVTNFLGKFLTSGIDSSMTELQARRPGGASGVEGEDEVGGFAMRCQRTGEHPTEAS